MEGGLVLPLWLLAPSPCDPAAPQLVRTPRMKQVTKQVLRRAAGSQPPQGSTTQRPSITEWLILTW